MAQLVCPQRYTVENANPEAGRAVAATTQVVALIPRFVETNRSHHHMRIGSSCGCRPQSDGAPAPTGPYLGPHAGQPSRAQPRVPDAWRTRIGLPQSGLRHLRPLRVRSPDLAQLQAAVHELSIHREELRRSLTMTADALAIRSRTRIIGAWTIAS
jgi:hypothetical protein